MSRQEVIRRIVERNENQLDLNEESVAREDAPLLTLACDTFGTWETALRYAGFSAKIVARQRQFTPDAVIRTIQRMCKDAENLTAGHLRARQWRLYKAAIQHFGSWHQALRVAGVNPRHVRPYPPDQRPSRQHVIEGIAKRQAQGLSLRWTDVSRDNRAFAVLAKNMFGSWSEAIRAAGYTKSGARLPPSEMPVPTLPETASARGTGEASDEGTDSQASRRVRVGKWSKPLIISALQALHGSGQLVSSTHASRALVRATTRYFGGWRIALSAAGIDLPRAKRPATRATK